MAYFRHQNAKEKESLYLKTLVTYQNGKVQQEIQMHKIMSVKNICLIHYCVEGENSTWEFMHYVPVISHWPFIFTAQDSPDLHTIVTIIPTLKTSVLTINKLDKHLTNVAINIHAPTYVKRIGGKWFLKELKKFMFSKFGIE